MKKLLTGVVVGLALVSLPVMVRAETETTTKTMQRKTPEEIEAYKREMREEKAAMREQVIREAREKKAQLVEDAKKLRDAKKQQLISNISDRMCKINANRTAAMQKHLDTMTTILGRIETRADKAEARGIDVSAVDTAVAKAKEAIKSAMEAVADQADEECGVTISGQDAALKSEAEAARNALKNQLTAAHEKVKSAREATANAITVLARALGEPLSSEVKEAN